MPALAFTLTTVRPAFLSCWRQCTREADGCSSWVAAAAGSHAGSVIAGATKAEQVRANAAAADWEPSLEDLATLDELTAPSPAKLAGVDMPN